MYKPNFLIGLTAQLEATLELMEDIENDDHEAAIALRNRFITALVDMGLVDAEALGNGEWQSSTDIDAAIPAQPVEGHNRATALAERALQERNVNAHVTHKAIARPARKLPTEA